MFGYMQSGKLFVIFIFNLLVVQWCTKNTLELFVQHITYHLGVTGEETISFEEMHYPTAHEGCIFREINENVLVLT